MDGRKVLLTGLGLGAKTGGCDVCNMSVDYLYANPSTLLWADKILISQDAFNRLLKISKDRNSIATAIMLQSLYERGLIEWIPNRIFKEVKQPMQTVGQFVSSEVKKLSVQHPVPKPQKEVAEFVLGKYHYCEPMILSIFSAIFVAAKMNAHCLFTPREYTYLTHFQNGNAEFGNWDCCVRAKNDIFSFALPAEFDFPTSVCAHGCATCVNRKKCLSGFDAKVQQRVDELLNYRERDELYLLRNTVDAAIKEVGGVSCEKDFRDVQKLLLEKERKIRKTIYGVFPKVRRWIDTSTLVVAPAAALTALHAGASPATVFGGVLGGVMLVPRFAKIFMDNYTSKSSWVDFLHLDRGVMNAKERRQETERAPWD